MPKVQLTESQIINLLNLVQNRGEFLSGLQSPGTKTEESIQELQALRKVLATALAGDAPDKE